MKISDLIADSRNANKGTKRGSEAVKRSLRDFGTGRSILIDSKGRIIAGNKTVANAVAAGLDEVIIVPSDGTKIVAVQRTDLDLETDPRAKALAVADNRTAELGLEWDPDILRELSGEIDLLPYFDVNELKELGITEPDFAPGTEGEQGKLDEKSPIECPNCHHKFSPK